MPDRRRAHPVALNPLIREIAGQVCAPAYMAQTRLDGAATGTGVLEAGPGSAVPDCPAKGRPRRKRRERYRKAQDDGRQQKGPTPLRRSGLFTVYGLAVTYFRVRNAHYHRRKPVSRFCSGWEGVGPGCCGRQIEEE